jgi:hypothetical protein
MRAKNMTEEKFNTAIALFKAGVSVKEVGRICGDYSYSTAYVWKKAGTWANYQLYKQEQLKAFKQREQFVRDVASNPTKHIPIERELPQGEIAPNALDYLISISASLRRLVELEEEKDQRRIAYNQRKRELYFNNQEVTK